MQNYLQQVQHYKLLGFLSSTTRNKYYTKVYNNLSINIHHVMKFDK